MQGDWYADWATKHATAFGLNADGDLAALLSWQEGLGATEAELRAATAAILEDVAGTLGQGDARFSGKMAAHRGALGRLIKAMRAVDARKVAENPVERFGTCTTCQSTGWVSVPYPGDLVKDGHGQERWGTECLTPDTAGNVAWRPLKKAREGPCYYEFSVVCRCALGRWVNDHRKVRALTLEDYTRMNPQWRFQLSRRAREVAALARAAEADGTPKEQLGYAALDAVFERLRRQAKGEVA